MKKLFKMLKRGFCLLLCTIFLVTSLSSSITLKASAAALPFSMEVLAEMLMIIFGVGESSLICSGVGSGLDNYDDFALMSDSLLDYAGSNVSSDFSFFDGMSFVLTDGSTIEFLKDIMTYTDASTGVSSVLAVSDLISAMSALLNPSEEDSEGAEIIDISALYEKVKNSKNNGNGDGGEPDDVFMKIAKFAFGDGLIMLFSEYIANLLEGNAQTSAGEVVDKTELYGSYFSDYVVTEAGDYVTTASIVSVDDVNDYKYKMSITALSAYPLFAVTDTGGSNGWTTLEFYIYNPEVGCRTYSDVYVNYFKYDAFSLELVGEDSYSGYSRVGIALPQSIAADFPLFDSLTSAEAYFALHDAAGMLNGQPYDFEGLVNSILEILHPLTGIFMNPDVFPLLNAGLSTAISSLGLTNDLLANTNLYIQALIAAITQAIADLNLNPDADTDGSGDDPVDDGTDLTTKDFSFDFLSLLNGLVLLIMILIALLMIFVHCMQFIINIFKIEASPGFLPDDMVLGLNYLKTLEITGMGISVYDFFMGLVYILLVFGTVGVLRRNAFRIKIPKPRSGGL